MEGLNPAPCAVYKLEDRFICNKCGDAPRVDKAQYDNDAGIVNVTLSCHGETLKLMIRKSELVFNQYVF